MCFFFAYIKKAGTIECGSSGKREKERKKKSQEHTKKNIYTHYVGGKSSFVTFFMKGNFFIEFMSVLDSTRDYCLKECDKIFFFLCLGCLEEILIGFFLSFSWIELSDILLGIFIAFEFFIVGF